MRIGVIGAGSVGGALGRGWAKRGHEVVFGVRDPGKPEIVKLLEDAEGARAASLAAAAAFGEVVVLATPWGGTRDAVQQAGDLAGKVLLDCTNPLKPDMSGLDVPAGSSAAEQVAAWAPGARVVKVFNTTGANNMAEPIYDEQSATMFYCGDDGEAKAVAARLAADLGFEPIDAGPLQKAALLESLALLWIHLAYGQKLGRDIAFKLMRR
jgi:8-hydroxy-5-deazaflavin:NADPH oxidoreductase